MKRWCFRCEEPRDFDRFPPRGLCDAMLPCTFCCNSMDSDEVVWLAKMGEAKGG